MINPGRGATMGRKSLGSFSLDHTAFRANSCQLRKLRKVTARSPANRDLASQRSLTTTSQLSPTVFLEIGNAEESFGQLLFELQAEVAPETVENFRQLCTGEQVGVNSSLSYEGCDFEPYKGKYSYTCKGRGKNIYGAKKFVESNALSQCRHKTPGAGGGVYYGIEVDLDKDPNLIALAVPISGPGFGTSRFVIVRVGESPASMQQRILANLLVIGIMKQGEEILKTNMSTRESPTSILACGEVE
ncbi:hypothetical protein CYMTET_52114 [Cymbomonas tetramitiformis]|uniref:PPIase cyclophilin-type domain-containing protein n=1 Tax=Cymbomonas tetramitiformis TaxID=36881 RepID=A0AAE0ERN4_9CHLO|nr:hypothetical protein CYMTET_52114 [Cymbomonas tetramitiformis]